MAKVNQGQVLRVDQGFNLIEVMASVVIFAIAMAAMVPTLTTIAYKRAISERIETARQVGQLEIERVRAIIDRSQDFIASRLDELPPIARENGVFLDAPAPDIWPQLAAGTVIRTVDGVDFALRTVRVPDSETRGDQYVVQTFRNEGCPCINPNTGQVVTTGTPPVEVTCAFDMVVRIYHRSSFNQQGDPRTARPGLEDRRNEPLSSFQAYSAADAWLHPMFSTQVSMFSLSTLDQLRAVVAPPGDPAPQCPGPPQLAPEPDPSP
ncbi:MAG: type II secretion system protein [Cyanobacteriota bacterium]